VAIPHLYRGQPGRRRVDHLPTAPHKRERASELLRGLNRSWHRRADSPRHGRGSGEPLPRVADWTSLAHRWLPCGPTTRSCPTPGVHRPAGPPAPPSAAQDLLAAIATAGPAPRRCGPLRNPLSAAGGQSPCPKVTRGTDADLTPAAARTQPRGRAEHWPPRRITEEPQHSCFRARRDDERRLQQRRLAAGAAACRAGRRTLRRSSTTAERDQLGAHLADLRPDPPPSATSGKPSTERPRHE